MTRRFDGHPLTWTTTHGDSVEVYSKVRGDGQLNWKWKRFRAETGQPMASSSETLRRRRDAIWHARRVNPPHPWIDPRNFEARRGCRADEIAAEETA